MLYVGENISLWQLCDSIDSHKLKTHYLKKIVGTNQIEKIEITCLLKTAAKLLVFSDISKLISNF